MRSKERLPVPEGPEARLYTTAGGSTFQQKAINTLKNDGGITDAQIKALQDAMIQKQFFTKLRIWPLHRCRGYFAVYQPESALSKTTYFRGFHSYVIDN